VPERLELPEEEELRRKVSSPKYDRPDRLPLMMTSRLPRPAIWTLLGVALTVSFGMLARRRSIATGLR
jgi:hypothetical protein